MSKGESKSHLYLLLFIGKKPKDLIKAGYNRHTVYGYSRRYVNKVKPAFDKSLGQIIASEGKK